MSVQFYRSRFVFGAECSPRHSPAPLFLRHFQHANAHTVRLTKEHQAATVWAFCGRPRSAGLPLVPNTESLPRANRAFPVQNPDLGPCAPRKMLSPKATAYGPAQLQNGPFGNSGLSQVQFSSFRVGRPGGPSKKAASRTLTACLFFLAMV